MTHIELAAQQDAYTPGEAVRVRMRIVNDGPDPVELPHPNRATSEQPVYTLTGPAFPSGKRFSMESSSRDEGYPLDATPKVTIRIDARSTWEEVIDLAEIVSIPVAGDYRLSCRYETAAGALQSTDATFRVVPFLPAEVMVGMGALRFGIGAGFGLFALPVGSKRFIFSLKFDEERPDLGEASVAIRRRLEVAKEAQDFTVADKNFPYRAEEADWIVWREGRKLQALSTYLAAPVGFDLGQEVARLVKPALKTQGGPLEILALSKDEAELLLASIDHSQFGEAKGFSVRWKQKLPAPPVHVLAALASDHHQSRRHLVLVTRTDDGIEIHHTSYRMGEAPSAWQTTPVKGVRAAQAFVPSLRVDPATGHAFCSLLVVGPAQAPASFIDIEWDERSQLVRKPAVSALHAFPEHIKSARVLVSTRDGGLMSRQTVLVDVSGRSYGVNHSGEVKPLNSQGTPTDPIILLPGKAGEYVLVTDSNRGLRAERVR